MSNVLNTKDGRTFYENENWQWFTKKNLLGMVYDRFVTLKFSKEDEEVKLLNGRLRRTLKIEGEIKIEGGGRVGWER